MMSDYISREKVLEFVEPDARPFLAERIRNIPAADVRPVVRGEWRERRFSEDVYGAECSVCHTTWDYGTNFCPNCGAEMKEET